MESVISSQRINMKNEKAKAIKHVTSFTKKKNMEERKRKSGVTSSQKEKVNRTKAEKKERDKGN